MKFWYKNENITNRAFEHFEKSYLKDWILELDTPEKRASLGIYEIEDPVSEPYVPTNKELLLNKIQDLEKTITDRRLREAILGVDNGWLQNVNSEITNLRTQLKTA
jgi:hypothetical protein